MKQGQEHDELATAFMSFSIKSDGTGILMPPGQHAVVGSQLKTLFFLQNFNRRTSKK